jgi:hypothetical protein
VLSTEYSQPSILDVDKIIMSKGKFELKQGDKIWRNKEWIDVIMPKKSQFNLKVLKQLIKN